MIARGQDDCLHLIVSFSNGGRLSAYQRNSPQRRCSGTLEREGARAGNESHVADACPCWVVRGQESMPGQSAPQDKPASILCKGRHAKRKLLTLQVGADPGNAKAADGCRGFVGGMVAFDRRAGLYAG